MVERWGVFQFQLWVLVCIWSQWCEVTTIGVWWFSWEINNGIDPVYDDEQTSLCPFLTVSSNSSRPTKSYVQNLQNKQSKFKRESKRSSILPSRPTLWLCLVMVRNENYKKN